MRELTFKCLHIHPSFAAKVELCLGYFRWLTWIDSPADYFPLITIDKAVRASNCMSTSANKIRDNWRPPLGWYHTNQTHEHNSITKADVNEKLEFYCEALVVAFKCFYMEMILWILCGSSQPWTCCNFTVHCSWSILITRVYLINSVAVTHVVIIIIIIIVSILRAYRSSS